jgi:fermentation-respiration switch protein FrsA (DUF1100 family)
MPTEPRPFTYADESFSSGGTRCAARIYRPTAGHDAAPVIVMAHGFGGVRALRLDAYAERFAAAGYVVVAFDYRHFGDSEGQPRQLLNVGLQHADWRAALAFARTLPGVNPEKVIAWGTSFAGGHVITLAGGGEPLAAIIAQVPHVSGPAAVQATGLRAALRLAPLALHDQLNAVLGRPPIYVEAVGDPGQTAIMTTPDAARGLDKLLSESGLTRDDYLGTVAARIALTIGLYSPTRVAAKVTCPALVQLARTDAVTPHPVALQAANKIAHSTVHTYDCGHFGPYVDPMFSTVIADQLAFLNEHVAANPAP